MLHDEISYIFLCNFRLAEEYVTNDPRKRESGTPIFTINQGSEPLSYTGFFPSWDENFTYLNP